MTPLRIVTIAAAVAWLAGVPAPAPLRALWSRVGRRVQSGVGRPHRS